MLVIMAAAFNLSRFPGFGGDTYQALFKDASGLHKGNMVQIGGIRVGRVQSVSLEDSNKVLVTFEVDHGVDFGTDSSASIEVLNLLGEKFLDVFGGQRFELPLQYEPGMNTVSALAISLGPVAQNIECGGAGGREFAVGLFHELRRAQHGQRGARQQFEVGGG